MSDVTPDMRRKTIVDALCRTMELFTSHNDEPLEDVMSNGIRPIADAVGLNRVVVYRTLDIDGTRRAGQIYRWDKELGGTVPPDNELVIAPDIPLVGKWFAAMNENTCIRLRLSDMTEEELTFLGAFSLKSILMVPIFAHGGLWGMIAMQDHENDAYFDEGCQDLLRAAALQYANAIIHHEIEREMREAEEYEKEMLDTILRRDRLLSMTSQVARILLDPNSDDFDQIGWRCMGIMAESVEADNAAIWTNTLSDDGRLSCRLLHLWARGTRTWSNKYLNKEFIYDDDLPGWDRVLSSGQHINSLVEDLMPDIRKRMEADGIKSVFFTPIFVNDDFWGFIGFERHHDTTTMDDIELDIFRSCCLMVANALLRNENVRKLKDATEAKSNFLANISHEMRTPLNSIIGMTLIGKNSESVERKDYTFSRIEGASANLLSIVNDVLDMSKIEANKMELSPVEFNLERMIQKAVSVLMFRFDEKKQKFGVHMDARLPHFVVGDDNRLVQVISNLLTNASKFTPEEGEISLNVTFISEENDICTLMFEVADDGIGISSAQLDKLFQPFSQAESGISRKYGGTGLGLAMCKSIVELMDGRIWVDTELGLGSQFFFTIKVHRGKSHLSSILNPGIKKEDLHIMVVDDDVITLNFFRSVFEHVGIKCDLAKSGKEALKMIYEKGDYDIYFIDWYMDEMNGLELSKRINARPGPPKKRNITIVSSHIPPDGTEITDAGVDSYMLKPLFASAIINRVNDYLDVESGLQEKNFIEATRGLYQGRQLLLVEDIDVNREILVSLLGETGIAIDEVENGKMALDMIRSHPEKYHLVFMDLQMPIMDGLEATRQIRALDTPYASSLPIIAMTANVFREDVERCYAAGMNGHLGKPLNMDEVLKTLQEFLGKGN